MKLFSFGQGFLGSLGHGTFKNIAKPKAIESLSNEMMQRISCGWSHSAAITQDGRVAVFGRTHGFKNTMRYIQMKRLFSPIVSLMNTLGQGRNVEYFTPVWVSLPPNEIASKVSCSAALTCIMMQSGRMYSFGSNNYGQCGIGSESMHAWDPTQVLGLEDEKVVDIAAGYQHVIAATKSGRVFSWGKGERGQLGTGTVNQMQAEAVEFPKRTKIKTVDAGFNQSAALSQDGDLFVWGKLLALPNRSGFKDQTVPRKLKLRSRVIDMKASQFHIMFRTEDNKLWLVGRQQNHSKLVDGKLVHVPAKMLVEPTPIALDSDLCIKTLCRGLDSTSFITDSGQVYSWDWTNGIQPVTETEGYKVGAYESGYEHHLMLAN